MLFSTKSDPLLTENIFRPHPEGMQTATKGRHKALSRSNTKRKCTLWTLRAYRSKYYDLRKMGGGGG